jgi:hypothetical protein
LAISLLTTMAAAALIQPLLMGKPRQHRAEASEEAPAEAAKTAS